MHVLKTEAQLRTERRTAAEGAPAAPPPKMTTDDDLDLVRVRELIREFAAALDEPERIDQIEAPVGRVLGLR